MKRRSETIGPLTGGMNRFDPETSLSARESPFLQNLTWRGGALRCRRGQVQAAQTLSGVLAAAGELFHGWLVLHAQDTIRAVKLAQDDPASERETGSAQIIFAQQTFPRCSGVFFRWRDELFYKTRGAYLRIRWNESQDALTATLLADTDNGTPLYIPVIQINTDPATGAGDLYQPENLLSGYQKVRYNAAALVTEYHLPVQGIDAVQTVLVGGLPVEYTADLERGVVTFQTAPPVSDPPENNTVEICYRRTDASAADRILDCTAAGTFGTGRDLCIVLGGNRRQPNAYYWTGNNGLVMDPTYFPVTQYNLAGDTSDPITCFGLQQNMLVIFQNRAVGRAALSTTELGGRVQIALDYTRINTAVGCDLPGTLRLVENNLVWCSRRHGVCRLRDTTAAAENAVAVLSRKLNGDDTRPGLLRALRDPESWRVSAAVFDGRWLLTLGDAAYEWNYAMSDSANPAWFFHRGIGTLALIPAGGGRLFGVTPGGVIVSFEPVCADLGGAIEKICDLPTRLLGSADRLKTVCSILFRTCSDAAMNTQVTYACGRASRRDPTNLTVTIPDGEEPDGRFPAVFRRYPGWQNAHHLAVRLYNNTAGEDLSFVTAQIIYAYRGRQR